MAGNRLRNGSATLSPTVYAKAADWMDPPLDPFFSQPFALPSFALPLSLSLSFSLSLSLSLILSLSLVSIGSSVSRYFMVFRGEGNGSAVVSFVFSFFFYEILNRFLVSLSLSRYLSLSLLRFVTLPVKKGGLVRRRFRLLVGLRLIRRQENFLGPNQSMEADLFDTTLLAPIIAMISFVVSTETRNQNLLEKSRLLRPER